MSPVRSTSDRGSNKVAPSGGDRRKALVEVAVDLFTRRRYDDIYISDIAREARVAHGLLFYHFKDKRGLYLAALKRWAGSWITGGSIHRPCLP
jgi:AcrR family transcriptional regulator